MASPGGRSELHFSPRPCCMAQPAASKVLHIQELAERILGYTFERTFPHTPAKQCGTLVTLARVNKTLSRLALAELWSDMESSEPLLLLLAPKLQQLLMPWKFAKKPQSKLRLPRAKDLLRYVYYSRFVQALDLIREPQARLQTLERADYLVVEFGLNDQHYPNLKTINVQLEHFVDWPRYFTLRTGPTTQSLFFTLESGLMNIDSMKEIGKQWTNISSFQLATRSQISRQRFRQVLRPVIAELKSLKYIKIHVEGNILAELLQTLSALPDLEDIFLAISSGPIIEPKAGVLPPPRPYTGKNVILQCETPNPPYFPVVLKISAELSMLYSTIKLASDPNSKDKLVADTILSILKYQPEVQSIYFLDRLKPAIERKNNIVYVNPETYPLSSPIIMPLTQLENLTDIDFDTCGPVMVTPELLDALASAAPLLRTCHLSPYRLARSNQHMKSDEFLITIQDVMRFLARCTRLFEVGLAFDARRRPNHTKEAIPPSPSWVAHLHIGGSRIDDVEYVGELLASLPRMGLIVIMPPDYLVSTFLPTHEETGLWYKVNVRYLIHRECGCGKIHDEDKGPPPGPIEYPYKVLQESTNGVVYQVPPGVQAIGFLPG